MKNDIKPTETKPETKPQVRIVDLEEIREVLGAAAAAQALPTSQPIDTTMCPW